MEDSRNSMIIAGIGIGCLVMLIFAVFGGFFFVSRR